MQSLSHVIPVLYYNVTSEDSGREVLWEEVTREAFVV